METLSFEHPPAREPRAWVREILQLQEAVARVRASLRSFARYAPEEVVREVAASGREASLTADRREVTALFCDLRGFTGIAEKLGPERVVAILNEHFDVLSGLAELAFCRQALVVGEVAGRVSNEIVESVGVRGRRLRSWRA